MHLTPQQRQLIEAPAQGRVFLSGPAGSGKTTVGVERMLALMAHGIPGGQILLLMPQRTLGEPYRQALYTPGVVAGSPPSLVTIGGLARRMIELFWPLIAEDAGFANPELPPTFLTLETAQYYMAHVVRPLLEEGMFTGIAINRNRLYSQLIDNLNKAAFNGFPLEEIALRLRTAWPSESQQGNLFEEVQTCVNAFRAFCRQHNLLDFSLQIEVFYRHLWQAPDNLCRQHLQHTYRHLIADNLEENPPIVADILRDWLPEFDSALLIFDEEAGYRRFLGAAPQEMATLQELCADRQRFEVSLVTPQDLLDLGTHLTHRLRAHPGDTSLPEEAPLPPPLTRETISRRIHYPVDAYFYPKMLDWVSEQISALLAEGVPAGEIVVLAPFLSDALHFALSNRLEQAGIPTRSHRPSRALRDEPATLALLTLAELAHPQWGIQPSPFDFTLALMQSIADVDLVRAHLLTKIVYRTSGGQITLTPFEGLDEDARQRVTYRLGTAYDRLRQWLDGYQLQPPQPLDYFFSRLFGEVLSQPGFGFHSRYDAAQAAARLIESVQKFRQATGEVLAEEGISPGQEYLHMVRDGVIAAQYLGSWQSPTSDAVYLAPAYTFLMQNRPVDYQFWLDVGNQNWFVRIAQPLTHPYILSRNWEIGRPWTDFDEVAINSENLRRLALGLIRRCRKGIFLGISTLNEQGYEQRGPLYRALAHTLMT